MICECVSKYTGRDPNRTPKNRDKNGHRGLFKMQPVKRGERRRRRVGHGRLLKKERMVRSDNKNLMGVKNGQKKNMVSRRDGKLAIRGNGVTDSDTGRQLL